VTSPTTPGDSDTIIAVSNQRPLRSFSHDPLELPVGEAIQETQFKIRLANNEGRRSQASYLIKRRYAWRGYQTAALSHQSANHITLAAFDHDASIATITVGIDSPAGLSVEALYSDEVKSLRSAGAALCEFTRLAVDNMSRSLPVLAAIFHIAYIYAHRIRRSTDLLVEVNPRHVKFYKMMLGFELLGGLRMDPRVSAPALLLRLDLAHAEAEIARLGGRRDLSDQVRSLYPLFFSEAEEKGIEGRLLNME